MSRSTSSKLWLALLLLIAGLLLPAGAASAQGPIIGDKVIFGGSFTLESGQVLQGDLVIFGGSAQVQEGALVEGAVAVIGGSVQINGEVRGDVSVVGGSLALGSTAVVSGSAVNFGGSFDRHPDAVVRGDTITGFRLEDFAEDGGVILPPLDPETPRIEIEPPQPRSFGDWLWHYLLRGLSAVAWAMILAVFGVLLLVFAPQPTARVAAAATTNPLLALLVGLVAWVAGLALIAILTITLCLAPFAAVLGLALLAAWFFGWLALGWYLGRRLLAALNMTNPTPILEAALGVVLLTLLWRMPQMVPFIGSIIFWVIGLFVGWLGLGAVTLTYFGTRAYEKQ